MARQHRLILHRRTLIMGVINLTPDSFSGDGLLKGHSIRTDDAVHLARLFVKSGADILDVGGESTRPGAERISADEEIRRTNASIKRLCRFIKKPVSIDTYKPAVAQAALKSGASIVNTIMGTNPNKDLLNIVRRYKAAIVLTHIRGTPKTMQVHIHYDDLMNEIKNELNLSIEKCLEMGIKSDRIIIDPGIGFSKTVSHNLEILNRLHILTELNKPVLIGTSRKSFIGKVLGKSESQRTMGTAATVATAILHGARIVRVHDVEQIRDTVRMTDAILSPHLFSNRHV